MDNPLLPIVVGIIIPITLWFLLFFVPRLRKSKDQSPAAPLGPAQMTERNQASAMLIAGQPFAYRVRSIFNLLDKISTLEKECHDLRSAAPFPAPVHPE